MPPADPDLSARARTRGTSVGATAAGPRWIWPGAVVLALLGAGISGYLTVTGLADQPPVCLAGDCAAVAASPYARFMGLPTAAWGLGLYVVVAGLAAGAARRRGGAGWLPLAILGVTVFGLTFSLYLLWIQVAVLNAVCSWCAASDVLWAALVALALAGALREA